MSDDRVRHLDPPRKVLVRHDDGHWYTGLCEGWVWMGEQWRASVWYTVAVGAKHVRTLPRARVQLVED